MPRALLSLLSDGRIHSGESLGKSLGLSRAAIWKRIQRLFDYGISVVSIKGHGYQLENPVLLLDKDSVLSALDESASGLLSVLDIRWSVTSTNTACLDLISKKQACSGYVCIAEHQSEGRGRRGRRWLSPVAGNIYMSVVWEFAGGIEALEGLSLAVGVCVAGVLQNRLGLTQTQLKWPNDILCSQKKVGGILIEMAGDATGQCYAVIGIGLNVDLPAGLLSEITQPYTDLCREMQTSDASRNSIVAMLLDTLLPMLRDYEYSGFARYRQEWKNYDALLNREVVVQYGKDECLAGVAKGISESGSILVDINGTLRRFSSGEVSLRRV